MKRSESRAQIVWQLFEQISSIPRPSGHEEKIGLWVAQFARQHGFTFRSDSVGNTVVEVAASKGYQSKETVILQGHLDMVCQKQPDSPHDFTKDPITLIERDGWVYADRTTLGADNGIGVALALGAAIDPACVHPKLELLFTIDEETGLTGANALAPDFVKGKRLLNLDSEDDSFTVGCAGGEQTQIDLPIEREKIAPAAGGYLVSISGLRGGHSGVNIHEQRANSLKLLTRVLAALFEKFDIRIAEISGGSAHNAIPREAQALISLSSGSLKQAQATLESISRIFRDEFSAIDPDIKVGLAPVSRPELAQAFSKKSTLTLTRLLLALPCGVNRFSGQFEGVVETSNNLAVISTDTGSGIVTIVTSQRSLKESCLDAITASVTAVASLAGASVQSKGRYPGWDPDPSSALLAACSDVYTRLHNRKPAVRVIHAGLECGIIGKKYPAMDMVSFGPTIENAHSPQERLDIQSVDDTWMFFKQLLGSL